MTRSRSVFLALTMTASMALTGPAFAEKVALKAQLNGASVVPPTTSQGTGTADIAFDTATKTLSWKLNYSGLSGPVTMAHFHGPAEPGKNAGVVVALPKIESGSEGSATLSDTQAADLLAGKYYVNVHTKANPAGEIRGQVTK
jgi:hypothetical protein